MKDKYLIYKLSETIKTTSRIDKELFEKYNVKRGLRNADFSGVLVGLTKIADVVGYEKQENGELKAIPGKLLYRGIDVEDLVHGMRSENRLGFEETAFLLLSGYLPSEEELMQFSSSLNTAMPLTQKAKMNILETEGSNMMNVLARTVLEMYNYDEDPESITRENLIRQSIDLIAKFPTIVAYSYHIYRHSKLGRSLHIRHPKEDVSIAENFLFMMKGKDMYTDLEVKILDLALILHADHGGGNNSTFTVRVTSSAETDTYSSIAAGIGSLKGPLHGGANIRVVEMLEHLKANISNWEDVDEIDNYLRRMLNKEVVEIG